ncbi:TNF receptor-associated factor 5-like [Hydra vulgaris]|uniref:TNF receptor-associated factor 5-like n=1 Tax=Hydra vulgaris TaxID=6087 RepID=A0ABM4DBV3_HYDVU
MEQIVQDGKTNLNYLNLAFNYNMNSVKNLQEIIARQIADYKNILHKQREDDQEIKNLKEKNAKLQQTLEETNKEKLELKNLVYDNMTVLTNQEDIQNLNQEIIKLNQIVEENSTEFLVLKKSIQQAKEVKVIQHIFKDTQIIKLDQMNLSLLSDGAFYSQPVYTSEGYYYRMKIYIRSIIVNNVAIYFQLLRGDLDDALKWPFTKKVICTLRNKDKFFALTIASERYIQSSNENSFNKPTEEYNIAVGLPNFIPHEELKQFIINNNLFIIVIAIQ